MHYNQSGRSQIPTFCKLSKEQICFKGNVCKPCLLIISDGNKKSFHVPITLITATVTIIVLIKGSTIEINRRIEPHLSIVAASLQFLLEYFYEPMKHYDCHTCLKAHIHKDQSHHETANRFCLQIQPMEA